MNEYKWHIKLKQLVQLMVNNKESKGRTVIVQVGEDDVKPVLLVRATFCPKSNVPWRTSFSV